MIETSKNEKNYSDYIQHMSNLVSGMFFVGGILLTIITLLLTQIPDLSILSAQVALFFLLAFFTLVGFLATYLTIDVIHLCRKIPPYSLKYRILNILMFLVATFWGLAVTVLFSAWNLTILTFVSLVIWILDLTASYLFIWKPFQRHRQKPHNKS